MELLSNICIRYEEQIEHLQSKVLHLEAKGMKTEIIIFGLIDNDSKQPK